jgi:N-acetylglucosaminyldiphosphoundecaprenol N-acetyl-beta-D-mannosaminyltransferase
MAAMTPQRIDFLDLPLDTGIAVEDLCQSLHEKSGMRMITFVNPASWALAERNPEFRAALDRMSLILPDGEGVASACRWLTGLPCPRISFDMTSLADPFFRKAVEKNISLMLAGGQPSVDENMAEKLKTAYPNLNIIGTVHGYGDIAPKAAAIVEKNPGAVIVGMGAPRQELFLLALRDAGYKGVAITCGGFFDQYLLDEDYYPRWIDKLNLRWLWRLYKEPARLWRRYLIDYQLFIWKTLKAFWNKYFPIAQIFAQKNILKAKDTLTKLRRGG